MPKACGTASSVAGRHLSPPAAVPRHVGLRRLQLSLVLRHGIRKAAHGIDPPHFLATRTWCPAGRWLGAFVEVVEGERTADSPAVNPASCCRASQVSDSRAPERIGRRAFGPVRSLGGHRQPRSRLRVPVDLVCDLPLEVARLNVFRNGTCRLAENVDELHAAGYPLLAERLVNRGHVRLAVSGLVLSPQVLQPFLSDIGARERREQWVATPLGPRDRSPDDALRFVSELAGAGPLSVTLDRKPVRESGLDLGQSGLLLRSNRFPEQRLLGVLDPAREFVGRFLI